MKITKLETFLSYTLMIILVTLSAISAFGQCNRFASEMNRADLALFERCEGVQVAKLFPGDEVILAQPILRDRTYRVLLKTDEYLEQVTIELLNKGLDESVTFHLTDRFIDVTSTKEQLIQLKVAIPKKVTLNKIQRSGCVALAIGSGKIEKLVVEN